MFKEVNVKEYDMNKEVKEINKKDNKNENNESDTEEIMKKRRITIKKKRKIHIQKLFFNFVIIMELQYLVFVTMKNYQ